MAVRPPKSRTLSALRYIFIWPCHRAIAAFEALGAQQWGCFHDRSLLQTGRAHEPIAAGERKYDLRKPDAAADKVSRNLAE